MPRTQLPNTSAVTLQPTGATGTALNQTFTAADVANGNYFIASGRDMVEVYNSDIVSHNLSVKSAPDSTGRTADITSYVIPPVSVLSPPTLVTGHVSFVVLPSSLFTQTDGTVQLSADSATVYFSIKSL